MGFFYSTQKTFEAFLLQIRITDQDPMQGHQQEACGFPVKIINVMCACIHLPSWQSDFYLSAIGCLTWLVAKNMIRYIVLKGTPFKYLDFCGSKAISKTSTASRDSLRKKCQNSTCIFHHNHPNFRISNCIHQIQTCSLKTNSNSSSIGLMEGGYKITDQFATYFLTFSVVGWIEVNIFMCGHKNTCR